MSYTFAIRPVLLSDIDALVSIWLSVWPLDAQHFDSTLNTQAYLDEYHRYDRSRLTKHLIDLVTGHDIVMVVELDGAENMKCRKVVAFSLWEAPLKGQNGDGNRTLQSLLDHIQQWS